MAVLSQSFHEAAARRVSDNRCMRKVFSIAVLAAAVAVWSSPLVAQEKASAAAPTLAGGWTRNADLSDAPPGGSQQGGDAAGRGDGSSGGGRHRGGGGGGGGYGGGGHGRGGGMGRGG